MWKHPLIAPLQGIECLFCKKSPHYQWKRNFRSKTIQEKINQQGHKLGLIKEIEVLERNLSGRVKRLKLTSRDGGSLILSGKEFRSIVGPNELKSNNYNIVMKGYFFDVLGKGWGHGVGLCQWGALEMARRRYSYEDILKFYYPGVEIKIDPSE